MKRQKLHIVDERILQLAEWMVEAGKITFAKEMFDAAKISKQIVTNVRTRGQHFTVRHIEAICKQTGVDINWVFGMRNGSPYQKRVKRVPDTELRKILPVTKTVTKNKKNGQNQ